MIRRPPRSTRTDTRFPYTTLFRSRADRERVVIVEHALQRSCGLEVDDAQIALAVLDAGSLAHRRARIDAESGGQPVGPAAIVAERTFAFDLRLLCGERADGLGLVRAACEGKGVRSEARSVGKECVSTCRSRLSPYH